jgi:nucleotide-binding universal stress UspA family protein
MKILMATDGSKEADIALRTTTHLLKPKAGDVCVDLICVAPSFHPSTGFPQLRENYHRRTRRILERARKTLCGEGSGNVRLISETGSPARIISNLAADHDLTVIGAKGREDRSRGGGLGPVASAVVNHAPGAILIGRAIRADRGARILVALDGSAASLQALETLTSLFELDSAEVTLMHVVETPWLHIIPEEERTAGAEEAGDDAEISEELLLGELRSEAQQLIERARDQLLAEHSAVSTVVEQGNPATELLSQAETGEYDLVVVGGTGVLDLKHKILGSVSAQIAWNAPCSVLLVKSEP